MTHSRLETEDIGDVTVVQFTQNKILDQNIVEQLIGFVDNFGRRKLLLNLSNVECLSSAALARFITLHKKLMTLGGRLELCNIEPEIYEILEITKLDKLLNVYGGKGTDEPGGELGGVRSPLIPPKPPRGQSASLWPPPPDSE